MAKEIVANPASAHRVRYVCPRDPLLLVRSTLVQCDHTRAGQIYVLIMPPCCRQSSLTMDTSSATIKTAKKIKESNTTSIPLIPSHSKMKSKQNQNPGIIPGNMEPCCGIGTSATCRTTNQVAWLGWGTRRARATRKWGRGAGGYKETPMSPNRKTAHERATLTPG